MVVSCHKGPGNQTLVLSRDEPSLQPHCLLLVLKHSIQADYKDHRDADFWQPGFPSLLFHTAGPGFLCDLSPLMGSDLGSVTFLGTFQPFCFGNSFATTL